MAVEIFREPVYRRYFAPLNSYSFLHSVFMLFLVIFLPLIIAYNSTNFWLKENTVYEQPEVTYRYEAIVQFAGRSAEGSVSYYWSSSAVLNQMHSDTLRAPVLRSAEFDDDQDGSVDRLEVNLQLPVAAGSAVTGVQALLFHDVRVKERAKYQFDAVSLFRHESASALRTLTIDSDVAVRQRWPMAAKGGYRNPYQDEPLLDLTDKYLSVEDASIERVLQRSAARNFSLVTSPSYVYTEALPTDSNGLAATQGLFNATFILRIPHQDIRYTPNVSEVLKVAWVQYMAFFIVVAFLLYRLNAFIFRHRLLYAHVVNDVAIGKTL